MGATQIQKVLGIWKSEFPSPHAKEGRAELKVQNDFNAKEGVVKISGPAGPRNTATS